MQNQLIGPFRILAPLGAGGMAEVVRALDIRLDCEDPPNLAEIVDSLQMTLDRTVRRGLGEEAGRRFQSASDLEPAPPENCRRELDHSTPEAGLARRRRPGTPLAASEDAR